MEKFLYLLKKNRTNLYIILTVIFKILYQCSYILKYGNIFKESKIIKNTDFQKYLVSHGFIHKFFCFFGTFLISLIFYKLSLKDNKNNLSISISELEENNSNKLLLIILIINTLLIIQDNLVSFYVSPSYLSHLDFWMIELLIIYYFNRKFFHTKLYKHQKLSFIINIIPCILKIITIIISFINSKKEEVYNEIRNELLYISEVWVMPLGIIFYVFLLFIHSYSITKIKWMMDLRDISPIKILLIYGIIGVIIFSIFILISSFKECPYYFERKICKIKNNEKYYFENVFIYYNKINKKIEEIIYEIISNIFGVLSFFLYKYYSLLIIKNLTPIHIIIITPFFFFVKKTILPINTLILEKKIFTKDATNISILKFILDIIGDFFSLIAFLIFFEIIELKFCGLNHDIKKNMEERAKSELTILTDCNPKEFVILADGDIEERSFIEQPDDQSMEYSNF